MAEAIGGISPSDLRVIDVGRSATPVQVVDVVPEGKVFVLTAWTLASEIQQVVTARLRRTTARVAFSRTSEPAKAHNHLTFQTGIPFMAGDQIEIEGSISLGQHYFYGYELDLA